MLETAITALAWVLGIWVGALVSVLSVLFLGAAGVSWIAKKIMDDNY